MKTPITYYGGKQTLLGYILPKIPTHKIYTEAFFGGGAVFFAKDPVPSEVINDTNAMVTGFFEVCQTDFDTLKQKIEATNFSRVSYKVAMAIYEMPHLFSKLQQAWAFYIATNMGFSCKIGSWGYDKYGKRSKAYQNKKLRFDGSVSERLNSVVIEYNDACKVIESRDTVDTFHYVDPPYIDSNQGHYAGYTETDYIRLLDTLSKVKGKFLLSSYPSEVLDSYIQKYGWKTETINKPLCAGNIGKGNNRKRKIEVLTANYNW